MLASQVLSHSAKMLILASRLVSSSGTHPSSQWPDQPAGAEVAESWKSCNWTWETICFFLSHSSSVSTFHLFFSRFSRCFLFFWSPLFILNFLCNINIVLFCNYTNCNSVCTTICYYSTSGHFLLLCKLQCMKSAYSFINKPDAVLCSLVAFVMMIWFVDF